MLTETDASARAVAIWGAGAAVVATVDGGGFVVLSGGGAVHKLDAAGHVACGHVDCRLRERDVGAAARVSLRRVLSTRLGMPDQIQVWQGDRCVAYITAAAGGFDVVVGPGHRIDLGAGVRVLTLAVRVEAVSPGQGPDRGAA